MIELPPDRWTDIVDIVRNDYSAIIEQHMLRTGVGNIWIWPEQKPECAVLRPPHSEFIFLHLSKGADVVGLPYQTLNELLQAHWCALPPGYENVVIQHFGLITASYRIQTRGSVPTGVFSPPGFEIRRLTSDDSDTLARFAPEWLWTAHVGPEQLLDKSIAVGAWRNNELVAVSAAVALSETAADLGVWTRRDHRRQGLAVCCTVEAMKEVHRRGLTSVWITNDQNVASLGVARRLGFQLWQRRYLSIPKTRSAVDRPHLVDQ